MRPKGIVVDGETGFSIKTGSMFKTGFLNALLVLEMVFLQNQFWVLVLKEGKGEIHTSDLLTSITEMNKKIMTVSMIKR